MADSDRLKEDASYFARLAVQYDNQKQCEQAKFFYMVGLWMLSMTIWIRCVQFTYLWNAMSLEMRWFGKHLRTVFSKIPSFKEFSVTRVGLSVRFVLYHYVVNWTSL